MFLESIKVNGNNLNSQSSPPKLKSTPQTLIEMNEIGEIGENSTSHCSTS